jgi:hypothetical protein
MKNNPYDVEGKMDKSEALKMLDEIHKLCKETISTERSINYDPISWTHLQFAESEIDECKSRLISKKIQRQFALKLLHRVFTTCNDVTPENEQLEFERLFGTIIEQYGFDVYLLIVGCTKSNWLDSQTDSKIGLRFINYLDKKTGWGNSLTEKQIKKHFQKKTTE